MANGTHSTMGVWGKGDSNERGTGRVNTHMITEYGISRHWTKHLSTFSCEIRTKLTHNTVQTSIISGSRFYVWFTFSLSWQASHYTCTIERSLKHRKKAIVVRDERPVGLGNSSVPAIWSMSSAVMSSLIILCSASCIRWCILFWEDSVAWHNVDCEWPGYL